MSAKIPKNTDPDVRKSPRLVSNEAKPYKKLAFGKQKSPARMPLPTKKKLKFLSKSQGRLLKSPKRAPSISPSHNNLIGDGKRKRDIKAIEKEEDKVSEITKQKNQYNLPHCTPKQSLTMSKSQTGLSKTRKS